MFLIESPSRRTAAGAKWFNICSDYDDARHQQLTSRMFTSQRGKTNNMNVGSKESRKIL